MRWVVEVSSNEKTDLQKYVVEAESWQRALQAARAQRGEQGPMSGFSIELLDEGYRAVDPVARNRFTVKRAPDDAPVTVDAKATPSKPSVAPKAPTATKSIPPRPGLPSAAAKKPDDKKPDDKKPADTKADDKKPDDKKPADTKADDKKPADTKADKKNEKKKNRKSEKMKAAPAAKKESVKPPKPSVKPPKPEPKAASAAPPAIEAEAIEPEEVEEEAPKTEAEPAPRPAMDSIPPAPLLPIGAFIPGLPSVKLISSREQDPSDASPLTYREYSFSVKAGTTEEVGEKVLRGQLKIVQAHLEKLKQGKLVNLAVFDVEFTGKPPSPPLATLAWKDWKGDPVVSFPRRTGQSPKAVKPPTASPSGSVGVVQPPPSMPPAQPPAPAPPPPPVVQMPPGYSQPPPAPAPAPPPSERAMPRQPGAIAAMVGAAKGGTERRIPVAAPSEPSTLASAPPNAPAPQPSEPVANAPVASAPQAPFQAPPNPFAASPSAPPPANPFAAPGAPAPANPFAAPGAPAPANPFAASPSGPPPPNAFSQTAPLMPPMQAPFNPASVPPPAHASVPPPAAQSFPPPAPGGSIPPPAYAASPPVVMNQASPSHPPPRRSSHPPDGVVRTPSGRFVRGRITGDELITQLFESMHDLHFLRDALDGGQFCLALATEMLPAKVAVIHFFDIERREWIVACARGKDANKLLTLRTPENDDLLLASIRHRRAIVTANGQHAAGARYQAIGGAKSMIIAPIMQAGRALGALEVINPADGMPFNEDEGNAITYIAEQYAEYLGSRGIIVQPDRIQAAARG